MTYKMLYKELPPCQTCMPALIKENGPAYNVYHRVFGMIENIDPFRVMDLVGIIEDEKLFCLDLIQNAQSEVMRANNAKKKKA